MGVVVGLCLWLLVIETTPIGHVPRPSGSPRGAAAGAIQTQTAAKLLAPGLGLILLGGYAGLAAWLGALVTTHSDVD
ncbi:MAG: hypothetical protein JST59_28960 [Actinobacteria bacterium]|nr:hypothetical protein [Actinomycetota bacterium]